VDAAGFAAVGEDLDAFAGQVFSSLPRSDQRATGGLDPLAHRTRLPGTENRCRTWPFRGPQLDRLAPPRHPGHRRPCLPDLATTHQPKSSWEGLTLYALLGILQPFLAYWIGVCPTCHARYPT